MKKALVRAAVVMSIVLLAGCTKSDISTETATLDAAEQTIEFSEEETEALAVSENGKEETETVMEESTKASGETELAAETEAEVPENSFTVPEEAYTDADFGPAKYTLSAEDMYKDYPDGKAVVVEDPEIPVLIYEWSDDNRYLIQDFDSVLSLDADSLTEAMIRCGVLNGRTKVKEFYVKDGTGFLKLNTLETPYRHIPEETLAQIVADTFCANMDLTAVELTAGDKEFGQLVYSH